VCGNSFTQQHEILEILETVSFHMVKTKSISHLGLNRYRVDRDGRADRQLHCIAVLAVARKIKRARKLHFFPTEEIRSAAVPILPIWEFSAPNLAILTTIFQLEENIPTIFREPKI